MSVSICEACAAESLVPSVRISSTSSSLSASALAFFVIAASHPWSAPGALNAILTVLPSGLTSCFDCPPAVVPPSSEHAPNSNSPSTAAANSFLRITLALPPRTSHNVGFAPLVLPSLSNNRDEHDHSLDDQLELRRQVEEVQEVEDQRKGQHADERAADRRPAPGEARPADHDGGNRVELVEAARHRRRGGEPSRQKDGPDAGAEPAHDVDAEDGAAHADT